MGGIIGGIIRVLLRNPTIFAGMAIAAYYMLNFNFAVVVLIFKTFVPYAIMYAIAFFYAMLFKHIYKPNSEKQVDWIATFMSTFTHFVIILIATFLSIAVIFAWNFAFTDKLDSYLRYQK